MATDVPLCRCGRPMILTDRGEAYCHHCDRATCKDPKTCVDCRIFDKATEDHAARTAP